MPSRASNVKPKQRIGDPVLFAKILLETVTGEPWNVPLEHPPERVKNPHAVAMAALGAAKGGRARAESLTAKQRSKIAKKAAKARWDKVA
jgi:hypothetical protein